MPLPFIPLMEVGPYIYAICVERLWPSVKAELSISDGLIARFSTSPFWTVFQRREKFFGVSL